MIRLTRFKVADCHDDFNDMIHREQSPTYLYDLLAYDLLISVYFLIEFFFHQNGNACNISKIKSTL